MRPIRQGGNTDVQCNSDRATSDALQRSCQCGPIAAYLYEVNVPLSFGSLQAGPKRGCGGWFMFLMEHHAKALLRQNGVVTPKGKVAETPLEAGRIAGALGVGGFAVKAQIGAGGRGLAGGVQFSDSPKDVERHAAGMLGNRLETAQTGVRGEIVRKVFVEERIDIDRMFYFSVLIDQNSAEPALLISSSGGVEFERVAAADPGVVKHIRLKEIDWREPEAISEILCSVGLSGNAAKSAATIVTGAIRTFFENDALLIEINPLAVTATGEAVAVDAKMVVDGNALPRHVELEAVVSEAAVEESERLAQENNVNFVELDGNIGLVVNGAGLGLATLDLVVELGGRPANFMDIRTTAGSFQIARVVQMLIERPDLKVMLVNVHGGGMTVCDTIAEALNFAYSRTGSAIPIVYRAAGQNAPWALSIMQNRKLPFRQFDNMSQAVAAAVEMAG